MHAYNFALCNNFFFFILVNLSIQVPDIKDNEQILVAWTGN